MLERKQSDLIVEWDDGSDKIGDFVHAGADIVVRDKVAAAINEFALGFTTKSIIFFDHPNLYKSSSLGTTANRVWLPYSGPSLCQLVVDKIVQIDPRSTVEIDRKCSRCGTVRYRNFNGVEKRAGVVHQNRKPRQGLFVSNKELSGADIFSPQYTSIVLCTDRVKIFIEKMNYTNVTFLNYGDIV